MGLPFITGNDRYDLARRLVEIAREPGVLDRLRAAVRPPKSIALHGAEIEAIYADLLSSAPRAIAEPPASPAAIGGRD